MCRILTYMACLCVRARNRVRACMRAPVPALSVFCEGEAAYGCRSDDSEYRKVMEVTGIL